MKRVLFVDDEPHLLDGLRGRLWRNRDQWETAFAASGAAALEVLEHQEFDIIVSDIRMPGMDGTTLLGQVQQRYPSVIRIALSGYTEMEAALRALPVAQQFLSKPCDGRIIENVLERACGLHVLLRDEAIRNAVGAVGELPSTPRIYTELTRLLAQPRVEPRVIAQVIEQDPGLSARLLQVVNSAFFGLPNRIASLKQAVLYLGVDTIKSLALSMEVFGCFRLRRAFSIDELQKHSYLTAKIAACLVSDANTARDVFTAGLLHDVGKLVLASKLPEHFTDAVSSSREQSRALYEVEQQRHGFTHAEAGAYLLGLWGLPYPIVEAVAHHHQPQRVKQCGFDTLAAVYIADHLAAEAARPAAAQADVDPLDITYLQSLGLAAELPRWRIAAQQQAALLGAAAGEGEATSVVTGRQAVRAAR